MISYTQELKEEWSILKGRIPFLRDTGEEKEYKATLQDILKRAIKAGKFSSRLGDRHALSMIAYEAGEEIYKDSDFYPRTEIDELDILAYYPVPTDYFTGRDDYLKKLHERLSESPGKQKLLAICGMGGIGKTQLALRYLKYHAEEFDYVFLVRAGSQWDLDEGRRRIAEFLNLSGLDNPEGIKENLKKWLSSHHNWLLIFDDADNVEWVMDSLPSDHDGKIIVTTRKNIFGEPFQSFALSGMENEDSVLFLLRRAGIIDKNSQLSDLESTDSYKTVRKIANLLDGYPLAIEQAGAYISKESSDELSHKEIMEAYFQAIKNTGISNMLAFGGEDIRHASATATINLSLEKIGNNKDATNLIEACAFLSTSPIPVSLFIKGKSFIRDEFSRIDSEDWVDLVSKYAGKNSLLYFDPGHRVFSMHIVVQRIVLEKIHTDRKKYWIELLLRIINNEFPSFRDPDWREFICIYPHVLALIEHIEEFSIVSYEAARIIHEAAQFAIQIMGTIQSSINMFELAIELRKKYFGDRHAEVACSLNALGAAYLRLGKVEKAEKYYRKALTMRIELFGKSHLHTARSHSSLGRLYRYLGKHDEAIKQFEQAWKIGFGENAPEIRNPADEARREGWKANWAWCLAKKGEFAEAEQLYLNAYKRRASILGGNHVQVIENLREIAKFYTNRKFFDKAKDYWNLALSESEKFNPLNVNVVKALDGQARLIEAQSDYPEAQRLFEKALAMARDLQSRFDIIIVLNHLADLLENHEIDSRDRCATLRHEAAELANLPLGITGPIDDPESPNE